MAAQVSPAGPRAAGRFGCSLLSIGATSAGGFDVLGLHWDVMEERSAQFGTTIDRSRWRLVGPMHIADTKEQAIADVEFGLDEWVDYFQRVAALPLAPDTANHETLVDALNASGFAVIGTVEDAVHQVERLRQQSKGFGTFLLMGHEWADTAATRHSYELIARYVAPEFQGTSATLTASRDWAAENRPEFIGAATSRRHLGLREAQRGEAGRGVPRLKPTAPGGSNRGTSQKGSASAWTDISSSKIVRHDASSDGDSGSRRRASKAGSGSAVTAASTTSCCNSIWVRMNVGQRLEDRGHGGRGDTLAVDRGRDLDDGPLGQIGHIAAVGDVDGVELSVMVGPHGPDDGEDLLRRSTGPVHGDVGLARCRTG